MTRVCAATRCCWMFPSCSDNATNADGTAIPANGFRLYPLNEPRWRIELLGGYAWALADDGLYTVTGRWGGRPPPAPVREAAIMLTCWMFKRYQAAPEITLPCRNWGKSSRRGHAQTGHGAADAPSATGR